MNRSACSLGMTAIPQHKLREALQYAKATILRDSKPDAGWRGDAVIICGGGKYLQWALNNVRNIRRFDPSVRVQVWCLNDREIPDKIRLESYGCEVVNVQERLPYQPRKFGGWHLKMWSVLLSPFRRVLFLDADCFASRRGLALLHEFENAVFFQDVARCHASDLPYFAASLAPPRMLKPPQQEWETGAFLVDKATTHAAIRLAVWMSEHSDAFWTPLLHGDKGSTEIAFRASGVPHSVAEASSWQEWGIDHRWRGETAFRHLLGVKQKRVPMPCLD